MKRSTVIIGSLTIAGIALLAYQKVTDLQATFDRLKISPSGIKNLSFGWKSISFKLDVDIKNPTNEDFAVNGMIATVRRIIVNYKGNYLADATLNISSISIPAFQVLKIKDLPISVSTGTILNNIQSTTSLSLNDLQITAVIDVLGKEYTISQ